MLKQDLLISVPLITARQYHIERSPKKGGSSLDDSQVYLKELGVEITESHQPIQFLPNTAEPIHRWASYVQGFSAKFVQRVFEKYRREYAFPVVLDPFSGSGTVPVQAKLNGFQSDGIELNPLLHFVAKTKLNSWLVNPDKLLRVGENLPHNSHFQAPSFLQSQKHFRPEVLKNLEKLMGGIQGFCPANEEEQKIRDLLLTAFAAILVDSSNLKRSPCLGYSPSKRVEDEAPLLLFANKIREMAEDLSILQMRYASQMSIAGEIFLANSAQFHHQRSYDLVITSPPYMNGLDYVINYKIEMGWLGFGETHKALKKIKDEMVVCDNVSKELIRRFSQKQRYTNDWIEAIKKDIAINIQKRGAYRRQDMPEIVHKYFDDMHQIMKNVVGALQPGGRFVQVIGDSLIADVYVPTDLILARIGQEMGLKIESIEKARNRRSGQIRSYQLRETIVTLKKE